MSDYKPRIADQILAEKLDAMGAVLVEGPKYCGKTTLCLQQAKSVLYMSDPATKDQNIALADTNVSYLLRGETPRLIDEWQLAPQLWDAIRHEIDQRNEDSQFLLTGSAVPCNSEKIFHSGAGRFGWLKLRTMSLWESQDSSGDVPLSKIFKDSSNVEGTNNIDIERLAFLTCRGGWPKSLHKKSERAALIQPQEYFEAVVRYDLSRVDNVKRDEELARRLMRAYARHQGSQATASTLLSDIKANGEEGMSENTIYSYINALKKIFVIEDAPAWNPNLRSKTAIRTSDTRYFTDPSIATEALGLGPQDLINDLNTFGLFFETLVIRDLRVYAAPIGGQVYHYRDQKGLECDAVVHLRNGAYGLIEIKLGGTAKIEEGATSLKKLVSQIDSTKMKAPSFLMVIIGVGKYAYRRADGVLVVPIGCLKH